MEELTFLGSMMAKASGAEIDIQAPGNVRERFDAWLMEEHAASDKVKGDVAIALGL